MISNILTIIIKNRKFRNEGGQEMKKIIISIFVVQMMLLFLTGCTKEKGLATGSLDGKYLDAVNADLKTFKNGDISEITECVFGVSGKSDTSDEGQDGIIAALFANAKVDVSTVNESAITYEIVSPNISNFFQDKADELLEIATTDELRNLFLEYAKNAPEKSYTVQLSYSITESGIDIDYEDSDFINAMTGGLLDAYADLYEQYLETEK